MRLALLLVAVGCSSSPIDVVGPFTGQAHRFVIDRFTLLPGSSAAPPIGDDLDGDGEIDNAAHSLIEVLELVHDLTTHAPDMIASGVLASEIEIVADDLAADDSVGVFYHGAPGDRAAPVGGRLSARGFAPNRTRDTRVPGEAVVRLPIFADTDPVSVRVVGLELALTPDGRGGFDGVVAGGMLPVDLSEPEFTGLTQMIAANPQDHLHLAGYSDADHDGVLSREEVASSPLLSVANRVDIQLFDRGRFHPVPGGERPDAISLGFAIHASPCECGRCAAGPPADPCHDRVLDGDETDVDCGGSCQRCPAAAACLVAGDCQTGACDARRCRAPRCGDGIIDGLETDLDCGGSCAACAVGQRCTVDHDCASGRCGLGPAVCQ